MIRVENVVFEYPGKRALDNVSFTTRSGSITALVGPNGAGKSTLMRSIAALEDVFSGRIYVDGIEVQDNPRKVHRNIGYLSDFFGLYDDLTVRQSLTYMARAHGIKGKEVQEKLNKTIRRLHLEKYIDTSASTLSRGWRQRLGIAQAIIHEPKLLLLDEPASGLDPEARQALSGLFLSLRDEGMTLMVSSHILSELEDYCTDMLLLRNGKIVDFAKSDTKADHHTVQLIITFLNPAQPLTKQVSAFQGVSGVSTNGSTIECTFSGNDEARHELLKTMVAMGLPVTGFTTREKSLQDIYMDIAQQENR